MIFRECTYFVNLRQAILSSPYYAQRKSSRTLLLTCVPREYLDERRLRKLYGDHVRRVYIPRITQALANLIKEREQTATRLEKAEVELILKANKARRKYMRNASVTSRKDEPPHSIVDSPISAQDFADHFRDRRNESISREGHIVIELQESAIELEGSDDKCDIPGNINSVTRESYEDRALESRNSEYVHPYGLHPDLTDVRGSVAARWIPVESRPYHRPLGNFGRRVDTKMDAESAPRAEFSNFQNATTDSS